MWFNKDEKAYKIKSIKTFAWDRARHDLKKYRTVYDKNELSFLSVAVEFYNKLFDEEEWDLKLDFKLYSFDNDTKTTLHTTSSEKYIVLKDENIALFEYGWGNKVYGKFWKKGVYVWEVFIDDELVGMSKFEVFDVGIVKPENNLYFEARGLNTYEAPLEDTPADKRVYLAQFDSKNTRYIMSEFKFNSTLDFDWTCELFFNYYDDTGLLVGTSESKIKIDKPKDNKTFHTITTGWGSKDGNSWIPDNYRVEVVFMDTIVGVISFGVADKNKKRVGTKDALLNAEASKVVQLKVNTSDTNSGATKPSEITDKKKNRSLDEVLEELNSLIGLNSIKNKINEYIDYVKFLQIRKEKGIEDSEDINLHSVFTGNPGTGKTTVVKLLGEIYKAMGILSKGHVVTVGSNDLLAGYVRQTGENTKKIIEKARGGILFIDEAYMLYKEDSPNDYGPEAITVLLTEISDGPGDIAIMMAGYPKEMEAFINSNPGLKSRIRNYYHFDDYTPTELVAIGGFAAKKKEVTISEEASEKLKKIITEAYRKRDKTFGNARLVFAMIDEAKINMGIRLVREYKDKELTKELLSRIEAKDIEDLSNSEQSKRLQLEIDYPLLEEAQAELNQLIGLTQIKKEVKELISLTKYYRDINRDVLKAFSLHSVFLGNPGTGKTTVARIIGKIYKALGLLERGHIVEADAGDLIAGFVGQTALKTKDLIKKAMGGILFIDEAYAITEGSSGGNSFGKKAIASLIKEMEDHRGEFGLIVAGYTDNMKGFLETNPGMKSRFDRTFLFNDFTEEELWNIAVIMLANKELKADKKAEKHLKAYINVLYKNRSKFFGNARSIRKLVEKAFRNQELRMANLDANKRTEKARTTLTLDDVMEFKADTIETNTRKSVGFKSYDN